MRGKYYKKYFKYKKKYLALKEKNNSLTIKILPNYEIYDIDTIEKAKELLVYNHKVVPINARDLVDNFNKDILITTNLTNLFDWVNYNDVDIGIDSVLVIIFNLDFGRYFAHYLNYNDFLDNLLNILENELTHNKEQFILKKPEDINIEYSNHCQTKSAKIKNSLPTWINKEKTVINLINFGKIPKIIARFKKLETILSKGTVNLYLGSLSSRNMNYDVDIENFCKVKDINFYKEHYGIFPDGRIFVCMGKIMDELTDKKLSNFYKSSTIKRISLPNTNRKSIIKFNLDLSHYLAYKSEYEEASVNL